MSGSLKKSALSDRRKLSTEIVRSRFTCRHTGIVDRTQDVLTNEYIRTERFFPHRQQDRPKLPRKSVRGTSHSKKSMSRDALRAPMCRQYVGRI